jgi:membrane-associated phospholipid phosphatase
VVVSVYVGATLALILLRHDRLPHAALVAAAHGVLLLGYAALRRAASRGPVGRMAFLVYLFAFVLAVFQGMGLIIPHVRSHLVDAKAMDAALAAFDARLFGSDPTRWFEPWLNPWTTLVLEICYSSYFFLPVLLTAVVVGRGRYRLFLSYAATIIGCFFTTYVGYYLVPAYGPRAYLAYPEPLPLDGVASALYATIDHLDFIKLNAFPSGHTAVSLVCLAILWREAPRLGLLCTPLVAGLIVATVALRYHYLIDVAAGALVAVLWVPFGMRLVFRFDTP